MPLPTTFFHLVRMWVGNERGRAKHPDAFIVDLTNDVDRAIAYRDAQAEPDHPALHAVVRRYREAQRAHAEHPTPDTLAAVEYDQAELDATIQAISKQATREQVRDQVRRRRVEVDRGVPDAVERTTVEADSTDVIADKPVVVIAAPSESIRVGQFLFEFFETPEVSRG